MHFIITTEVKGLPREVFQKFDQTLLLRLKPIGVKLEIVHVDHPPLKGKSIGLRTTMFGILKQEWENEFTEYNFEENACNFVDEGRKMPFPIKQWRHNHRVERTGDHSKIIDDITFKTANPLLDFLLLPFLWLQFLYRKPTYRKFFGRA